MRTRTLSVCLLVFLLVAGIFIAGCTNTSAQAGTGVNAPVVTQGASSQGSAAAVAGTGKMLKFGELWLITGFDPMNQGVFITEKAIVTESLISADENFRLIPNLATSWKQTSPTTWEVKLRDGVKFHNGKPMTAEEVKFSLDRSVKLNSANGVLMDYKSCRVIDPLTVEITTNKPNPILPEALHYPNMAIIHPDSLDANGNFSKPIGTGAMVFDSFDAQTRTFTVKKNPNYWGGPVSLEGMIISGIPDSNSRAMAIEKGEVDFTVDVPMNEVKRIDALPNVNVETYLTPRVYRMVVNFNRTPLQDKRVRQAISLAINRTDIVNDVLYGVGGPARGIYIPKMAWFNQNLQQLPYDPVKAKALLAEAGYKDTNGDGIVEKDGKPLTIDLVSAQERPGLPPMAEAIGDSLRKIGIDAKVEIMASAASTDRQKAGSYDLVMSPSNIAMVPDPSYIMEQWYMTGGYQNYGKYSNKTLDALIQDAKETTDKTERYRKFNELEVYVLDDLITIPIADYGCTIAKKDSVKGYKFDPTAHDLRMDAGMTFTG
ncbi:MULTISPECIES: ABC transporter substrate-binding protein [unclassified Methanoregula]|uniref:ABC transporter substrate-binding protein n=1 Tax=unclassified Methanoregula TaxID=2649730 RepID=UPI0009CD95F3|nr:MULTISPECIES: ABC transporter substrate-binding protein [unclassified Methanoregula]OPX64372.1 MAG: putative ABC transporter periplasmic-binding protein [Methanoregula sp. PtaB.Bin085]OPY34958.1 MAG: putative ABC transporter periplasmic-binding protein [Methanoregula sp. PtaU1.Bin006]